MKSNYPIKNLDGYIKQISRKNKTKEKVTVYSVTNSNGFTRSTDYFNKEVFSKNLSNYKLVTKNQFAYNPSRINVGSIDYLTTSDLALVSPLYIVFQTTPDLTPAYLKLYLKSEWGKFEIRSNTEGAVRDSLKYKDLQRVNIPLPTIQDQACIVQLLGRVSDLVEQRKNHLQQLDELVKSVFIDMFGDLKENVQTWKVGTLGDIINDIRNGLSPSKSGECDGLVYTLSSVTGTSFKNIYKKDRFSKLSENYYPKSDDFLICRGNGNVDLVGKGYFYQSHQEDVMFPDTIIGVKIDLEAVNNNYLEQLWKSRFIRDQIEKIARTANGTFKINQAGIKDLRIVFPPKDLQKEFSSIVEKIKTIRDGYGRSLDNLINLYKSLSQKAFKGELDLSSVRLAEASGPQAECVESKNLEIEPIDTNCEIPTKPTGPITRYVEAFSQPNAMPDFSKDEIRQDWLVKLFKEQLADTDSYSLLSLEDFLDLAQSWISSFEQEDGVSFCFLIEDYEVLKGFVFNEVRNGMLLQEYEEASNSIKLKVNKK